jgi:hypothetical protein
VKRARLVVLAARLMAASACLPTLGGCISLDIVEWLDEQTKKEKEKKRRSRRADREEDDAGATALGRAAFPDGTDRPVAKHVFVAKSLKPDDYVLEYAMSRAAQEDVLGAHAAFAKKTGYTPLDEGRYRWIVPPGCEPDMGCAFGAMSDANRAALEPLAELFEKRRKKVSLDAGEVAALVVAFVQDIHYERPKDQPFEILPPASVVAERRGDCDSKSLLAHLLLRELGVDSVMLSSRAHAHAMLGIAVPAPGKRFTFAGRNYAFTELTAVGSPIGHINPELLRPDDWKIVVTRWPDSRWSGL